MLLKSLQAKIFIFTTMTTFAAPSYSDTPPPTIILSAIGTNRTKGASIDGYFTFLHAGLSGYKISTTNDRETSNGGSLDIGFGGASKADGAYFALCVTLVGESGNSNNRIGSGAGLKVKGGFIVAEILSLGIFAQTLKGSYRSESELGLQIGLAF